MGILLAVIGAIVYGSADFAGGIASKRATTWSVLIGSQAYGLLLLLAVFPFLHSGAPLLRDVAFGAASGIAGAAGAGFLYRGLAIGRMSIVSPLTAVLAALLPVCWSLIRGERPSLATACGIIFALIAVVLVSAQPGAPQASGYAGRFAPGVREALISGCSFGLFFIVLAQTSLHAGLWPLIGARAGSLPLLLAMALLSRAVIVPAKGSMRMVALTGVLDMGANVLYLLSTKYTSLAIAAVVISLYPASTVLLARIVLHERLATGQWVGVACAGAGIALIALH